MKMTQLDFGNAGSGANSQSVEQVIRKRLKKGKAVFVSNNSANMQPHGTSILTMEIEGRGGKRREVRIPDTWLPFRVSGMFSAKALAGCTDFWQYIQKGMLVYVPQKKAVSMLKSRAGLDEQSMLRAKAKGKRRTTGNKNFKANPSGEMDIDSIPEDSDDGFEAAEPIVRSKVQHVCQSFKALRITAAAAKAKLRNLGKLTLEELSFVSGNGSVTRRVKIRNEAGSIIDTKVKVDKELTMWAYSEIEAREGGSSKPKKKAKKTKKVLAESETPRPRKRKKNRASRPSAQ